MLKTPKLLRIAHFSWGKIWLENFAPSKRIDILQLWLASQVRLGSFIRRLMDQNCRCLYMSLDSAVDKVFHHQLAFCSFFCSSPFLCFFFVSLLTFDKVVHHRLAAIGQFNKWASMCRANKSGILNKMMPMIAKEQRVA